MARTRQHDSMVAASSTIREADNGRIPADATVPSRGTIGAGQDTHHALYADGVSVEKRFDNKNNLVNTIKTSLVATSVPNCFLNTGLVCSVRCTAHY